MTLQITAVADDLSGAAEAAVLLAGVRPDGGLVRSASVLIDAASMSSPIDDVVVLDLDTRDDDEGRTGVTVGAADLGQVRFCKIDSLLRGRPAVLLDHLAAAGRRAVVTPALPALGRSLVGGRVRARGLSPVDTGLLALEADPTDVAADRLRLRPRVGGHSVGLPVVRGARPDLVAALRGPGHVLVDAETEEDLDAIVSASASFTDVTLVGSGGLAGALGRYLAAPSPGPGPVTSSKPADAAAPATPRRSALLVVGSASDATTRQLAVLEDAGVPVLPVPRQVLLHALADGEVRDIDHPALVAIRAARAAGAVAITIEDRVVPAPHLARRLAAGLGIVAATMAGDANLLLTGGETARRTLEHLGVDRLRLVRVIDHGCVLGVAADGRAVVTRPGSFGDPDNLLVAARVFADPTPAIVS